MTVITLTKQIESIITDIAADIMHTHTCTHTHARMHACTHTHTQSNPDVVQPYFRQFLCYTNIHNFIFDNGMTY